MITLSSMRRRCMYLGGCTTGDMGVVTKASQFLFCFIQFVFCFIHPASAYTFARIILNISGSSIMTVESTPSRRWCPIAKAVWAAIWAAILISLLSVSTLRCILATTVTAEGHVFTQRMTSMRYTTESMAVMP